MNKELVKTGKGNENGNKTSFCSFLHFITFALNCKIVRTLITLLAITLLSLSAFTVRSGGRDTSVTIPMFYGFYGYQWPGGDMADRFGSNSVIGPGFMVKTASNWLIGAEYNYLFGNNTKDGLKLLEGLMTDDGMIINGDGTPAVVALFERGFTVNGKFGKLIPALGPDRNSGFFFTAGLGYMRHKVRIDVENNSAPQLRGDYKRGYDRLSGGLVLTQSLGYMYFGRSNLLNFTLSLEVFEGFTHGYREYNFDTRLPGDEKRFDLVFGPKIAWMIPIRKKMAQEFYYY